MDVILVMKKSYGRYIDIKNTVMILKKKCLALPRSTSKCHIYETVSYPFGKGKIKIVNLLKDPGEKSQIY